MNLRRRFYYIFKLSTEHKSQTKNILNTIREREIGKLEHFTENKHFYDNFQHPLLHSYKKKLITIQKTGLN